MRLIALVCALVPWAFGGCTGSSVQGEGPGGAIDQDVAVGGTESGEVAPGGPGDTADVDLTVDVRPSGDAAPSEGDFGWPCAGNDDCYSGYCVPSSDGDQCTKTCESDCPEGWACKPAGSEGDLTFICVDATLNLCRPCLENNDCTGALGGVSLGSRCISYPGQGWFCGHACEEDGCPSGYSCKEVEDKSPAGKVWKIELKVFGNALKNRS